jgi:hypothetical protein
MDRLFGKELSNLVDNPILNCPGRNGYRQHSKLRGISVEHAKALSKKPAKIISQIAQNKTLPPSKPQEKPEQKNDQMIPEYFDDCLSHMLQQEKNHHRLTNYINSQTELNEKMRGILLDWIFDLHYKFKMFPETLYIVVNIIDRYLSLKDVKKDHLQLVGTAAFFIAAKYEETYQVPELDDLVHYAARAFTKRDLLEAEADIINKLSFDLIPIISFRFFEALAKMIQMEEKNFHLAQYVLELSLLDMRFLDYAPSHVACSAIYLINKIRKRSESWP